MPQPISAAAGTFIDSHIARLSYDHTLSPTLLLHLGAGYQDNFLNSPAETSNFNPTTQLGLAGPITPYAFPQFTGLCPQAAGATAYIGAGGSNNLGSAGGSNSIVDKTTAVASVTWVKDNHTYKTGGYVARGGVPAVEQSKNRRDLRLQFRGNRTSLPKQHDSGGGNVGFPYASFLLGLVDSGNISVPTGTRLGNRTRAFTVRIPRR